VKGWFLAGTFNPIDQLHCRIASSLRRPNENERIPLPPKQAPGSDNPAEDVLRKAPETFGEFRRDARTPGLTNTFRVQVDGGRYIHPACIALRQETGLRAGMLAGIMDG
jgi:hypothetical protein